jgi:hypothetical protein
MSPSPINPTADTSGIVFQIPSMTAFSPDNSARFAANDNCCLSFQSAHLATLGANGDTDGIW